MQAWFAKGTVVVSNFSKEIRGRAASRAAARHSHLARVRTDKHQHWDPFFLGKPGLSLESRWRRAGSTRKNRGKGGFPARLTVHMDSDWMRVARGGSGKSACRAPGRKRGKRSGRSFSPLTCGNSQVAGKTCTSLVSKNFQSLQTVQLARASNRG